MTRFGTARPDRPVSREMFCDRLLSLLGAALSGLALISVPAAAADLVSCDAGLGVGTLAVGETARCRIEDAARSRKAKLFDPEFNSEQGLVTWSQPAPRDDTGAIVDQGSIFVARLDRKTGQIGFGKNNVYRLDTWLLPVNSGIVGEPEWVRDTTGWTVSFTCLSADRLQPRICLLTQADGGIRARSIADADRWIARALPGTRAFTARSGSDDPAGPFLRIYSRRFDGDLQGDYREINETYFDMPPRWFEEGNTVRASEGNGFPEGVTIGRFIPGAAVVGYQKPVACGNEEVFQVATFDLASGEEQVLVNDCRPQLNPWFWKAPELDGRLAFSVIVEDRATGYYKVSTYAVDENGVWDLWNDISPPAGFNFTWSPEPFVFEGRSYISYKAFQGSDRKDWNSGASVIVIASASPDAPVVNEIVSEEYPPLRAGEPGVPTFKNDPETAVLATGVRVYYRDFRIIGTTD